MFQFEIGEQFLDLCLYVFWSLGRCCDDENRVSSRGEVFQRAVHFFVMLCYDVFWSLDRCWDDESCVIYVLPCSVYGGVLAFT